VAKRSYARGLYERSVPYYDLFHDDVDYPAEAARLHRQIQARASHARTLLDVGCGTGRHLACLRREYEVEGLDASAGLLDVARRRLPGVPLHLGDMRSFDLGRRFDIVTCLFAAIGYAETVAGLGRSFATFANHLAPKGMLMLEPWIAPAEDLRFAEAVEAGSALAVARVASGAARAGVFESETHYLVTGPGGIEHFSEIHVLGLFQLRDYEQALTAEGFEPEFIPDGRGLLLATHR